MRVEVEPSDPRTLPIGIDTTPQSDPQTVCSFGAAVQGQRMRPGGEMIVTLIVPFDQVPNVMPIMQHVGGIQFEVTFRRVPLDQLPEPGW